MVKVRWDGDEEQICQSRQKRLGESYLLLASRRPVLV